MSKLLLPKLDEIQGVPFNPNVPDELCKAEDGGATALKTCAANLQTATAEGKLRLSLPTPLAAPLHFKQRLFGETLDTDNAAVIGEWRGLLALLALCRQDIGLPADVQITLKPLNWNGVHDSFMKAVISYLPARKPDDRQLQWPYKANGTWQCPLTLIMAGKVVLGLLTPDALVAPSASYREALAEANIALPFTKDGALVDPLTLTKDLPGHKTELTLSWLQLLQLEQWLSALHDDLQDVVIDEQQGVSVKVADTRLMALLGRYRDEVHERRAALAANHAAAADCLPDYIKDHVSPDINDMIAGDVMKVTLFVGSIEKQLGGPGAFCDILTDEDMLGDYAFATIGRARSKLFDVMNRTCAGTNEVYTNAMLETYSQLIEAEFAGEDAQAIKGLCHDALRTACGEERGIFAKRLRVINFGGENPFPYANAFHRISKSAFATLPLNQHKIPDVLLKTGRKDILSAVEWLDADMEGKAYGLRIRLQFATGVEVPLTRRYEAADVITLNEPKSLFNCWVWPAMLDDSIAHYYVLSRPHSAPDPKNKHVLEPLNGCCAEGFSRRNDRTDRRVWRLDGYPWLLVLKGLEDEGVVCAWQDGSGGYPIEPDGRMGDNPCNVAVDFGSSSSVAVLIENKQHRSSREDDRSMSFRENDKLLARRVMSNGDAEACMHALREFFPEKELPDASPAERGAYRAMLSRVPSALIRYNNGEAALNNALPVLDYNVFFDSGLGVDKNLGNVYSDIKWGADESVRDQYVAAFVLLCTLFVRSRGYGIISHWYLGYPAYKGDDGRIDLVDAWVNALSRRSLSNLTNMGLNGVAGQTVFAGVEGLATAQFFIKTYVVDTELGFGAVDIGGSTTDIAIYDEQEKLVHSSSLRFAGREMLLDELLRYPQVFNLLLAGSWQLSDAALNDFRRKAPERYRPLSEIKQLTDKIVAYEESHGRGRFFDSMEQVVGGRYDVDSLLRWLGDKEIAELTGCENLPLALKRAYASIAGMPFESSLLSFVANLRFKVAMLMHFVGYLYRKSLGAAGEIQVLVGGNGSRILYWCDQSMLRKQPGASGGIWGVTDGQGRDALVSALAGTADGSAAARFRRCVLSEEPKKEVAFGLEHMFKDDKEVAVVRSERAAEPMDALDWLDEFEAWVHQNCAKDGWLRNQAIDFALARQAVKQADRQAVVGGEAMDRRVTAAMSQICQTLIGR